MDSERPSFDFSPVSEKTAFLLTKPGEVPKYEIPASINQYLRTYQREGVSFLLSHYQNNRGAILGDDMGLGKTVQVIAFISALLGKTGTNDDAFVLKPAFIKKMYSMDKPVKAHTCLPFLIIVPGNVLYNWVAELDTWGYFAVGKFHRKYKEDCLTGMKYDRFEVVLTTFETFRDNKDYLIDYNWAAVIVDEVHKIKKLKAQITQALRSFRSLCRYGLTGTALQNDMMELWSIIDWAQPGFLGEQTDFYEEYVKFIMQGQKHDATKRELAEARQAKQKFCDIRDQIMIRRTKIIIKDQLPNKDDNIVFCKLSDFQKKLHSTISRNEDFQNILQASDPCKCGSGKPQKKCCRKKSGKGRSLIFQFLHLLLKVANHPALLLSQRNSTERKTNQFQMIHDTIFRTNQQYQQLTKESLVSLSNPKYCGKMKVLSISLSLIWKSHLKVFIIHFIFYFQLLDILEVYLQTALYEFRRIDGQVSPKNRSTIVQEFNNDPSIFICLISTKAGGLGLNITGANVVIIFDPNWNPSHDLQAQDRAYRIGQRRDVQVFRLISSCSIEENIYLRQVYKQQLEKVVIGTENAKRYFFGIQGDQQHKGELFGLKNMFSFSEKQSSLVENILERNKKVEKQLAGHKVTKYVSITVNQKETESNDEWSDEEDFNIEDSSNGSDDNNSDDEEEMETESSSEEESPELMARGDSFKDLGNYGVVHVHKNRQITGASRAEDHMSKCAMEEVLQDQKNSQQLAMECEPYVQSPDSGKTSKKRKKMTKIKDYNAPKCIPFGQNQMVYGETPVAVVRDHLEKMVDTLQFSSLEELCQSIIKMSAANRAELLQQFYTKMYGSQIFSVFQKLPRFSQSLSTGSNQEENGRNQQKNDSQLTTQDNNQVNAVKKSLNSKTCRKKFTKLHHTHKMKPDFGNPFASPAASTSKTSDSVCGNQKYLHHRRLVSDVKYSSNTSNSNSSLDSENPETNLPTVPVDYEAVIFTEADNIFFSESNPTNTHRKPPPKSKLKFKR
ncbi:LOW QUALITY PROTEIN: DNA excision repair protein ERCC-6-like 2 [Octopus bimaculoides]|nr:LOW QUALITY PROTEIN: DNA excision repair protein ERCC-6-like 2 [Octopus bimaculoides]|eukprot:XP_014786401.1 PREDICTED: LOW QUALITY PROTEIN: DNA excision repair protein ERCC-6-like 2 [Octopus bimaculoides]